MSIRSLTQRLTRDGLQLISVPMAGDRTIEDLDPLLSAEDRKKRFGHHDHVRAFGGVELPERLALEFGARFAEVPKDIMLQDGVDRFAISQMGHEKRNFNRLFVIGRIAEKVSGIAV